MQKIIEKISAAIDKSDDTQETIAKKVGASGAQISQFKKNGKINFSIFYRLVHYLFDNYDEANSLVVDFFKQQISQREKNQNIEIFREAFEISVHAGEKQLYQLCCESEVSGTKSGIVVVQEIRNIYDVITKRNQGVLKKYQLHKAVEALKYQGINEKTSVVLLQILTIYSYYEHGYNSLINNLLDDTFEYLQQIKNKYLRQAFKFRLLELKLNIMLLSENFVEMEKIYRVFQDYEGFDSQYPIMASGVYLTMAQANLSDFEKSIAYLNKAKAVLRPFNDIRYERRNEEVKATEDFVKIVNRRFDNLHLNTLAERAHFYAVTGNSVEALELISELEQQGKLSVFQRMYKGLALRCSKELIEASQSFLAESNVFYSRLALRYASEL